MREVASTDEAAGRDDPAAPVFFLSYWRPDPPRQGAGPPREPNRFVMQFFDELSENVNNLIGSIPGRDPGYLDVARGGGELWERQLLHAAGTCQVLICLLSTPYLTGSEWCAREWDLFSRRRVVPRHDHAPPFETAVVPVLWTPLSTPLPPVVSDVNIFVPTRLREDFRADYQTDGLLGLLRTGQQTVYEAIVWRIAQRVEWLRQNYRVEPLHLPSSDDLRTDFERGPQP
ncbi:toll/interleukin-1 receptor domain-containing protein [Actinoplanes sp. LDG1-06]|uniref:Toll/interleukin-1 receptor domain-containing protein n=1 Tax=Paractinoplanes ovalisporus TaxID=2810368 RepID=A0ABS2A8S2_9ACTN|nr:TIR-like protein FxsC [Actinoplanes ovalisporus]MBM2616225.1 toll/interleukin-1 receptor domain-containing protein [Actinoplanes ovalisporus]